MNENMKNKFDDLRNILDNPVVRKILLWIFEIAVVLFFAIVVAIFMFQTVTMREGSMEPTFSSGNVFFINRTAYQLGNPERGDIIVFRTSNEENAALHIKRVIGLPGETIQIKDGQVIIDGTTYKEGKDFPSISNPGLAETPIVLDKGEYFVLGDNRNNSEDSRYGDIGTVNKNYIEGKLWFQVYPLRKIGFIKD